MSFVIDAHHPVLFIDSVIGKLVQDAFRRAQSPNNLLNVHYLLIFYLNILLVCLCLGSLAQPQPSDKNCNADVFPHISADISNTVTILGTAWSIIPFHRRVSSITHEVQI